MFYIDGARLSNNKNMNKQLTQADKKILLDFIKDYKDKEKQILGKFFKAIEKVKKDAMKEAEKLAKEEETKKLSEIENQFK